MTLRRLWASLNDPSRFDGQPIMGLYNQWGHFALGVAVYILACAAWFFIDGEMPPRWIAAGVMVAVYAIAIEWLVQGWQGRDSVEDTGFFAGGVLTVASSVQEVAATGWRSEIVVQVGNLAACIVCMSWACIAYAVSRYRG